MTMTLCGFRPVPRDSWEAPAGAGGEALAALAPAGEPRGGRARLAVPAPGFASGAAKRTAPLPQARRVAWCRDVETECMKRNFSAILAMEQLGLADDDNDDAMDKDS